jgi:hypothetical protein
MLVSLAHETLPAYGQAPRAMRLPRCLVHRATLWAQRLDCDGP